MSSSTDFAIRRLTLEEIDRRTERGYRCASGTCWDVVAFESSFLYRTGRAGRMQRCHRWLCGKCGGKFAARHGIALEATS
ncbi:hypothetical protein ACFWYW_28460 [Nonomuraea sp. NPDC059023]|uniref:hypothetical protein n=1 Tax=unclassified Nonomuraea TaxID=2593643 RepID=UPI003690C5EA